VEMNISLCNYWATFIFCFLSWCATDEFVE
jgi:hypothetical protein